MTGRIIVAIAFAAAAGSAIAAIGREAPMIGRDTPVYLGKMVVSAPPL